MAKAASKSSGKKPAANTSLKPTAKAAINFDKKTTATASKIRQLKTPKRRFHRLPKQFRPSYPKLPSAFRLLWRAMGTLKRHWKLFLGITLVYGILNIALVRGLASSNLSSLKSVFDQIFHGSTSKVSTGFTLFVYLLSSSGNTTNPTAGVYQAILLLMVSLAVIWSLRQIYAKVTVRIRDCFYHGMYPLIPFVLLVLVIGLQLLPLVLGASVYSLVINNSIAVSGLEKFIWLVIFLLLAMISLYMISSSIFALYIVTLPDMTPMKALRSARQLVRYRRSVVLRKILFLPVALMILAAFILVPLIIFVTPSAEWVYFALSLFGVAIIHSYLYGLYRELL